LNTIKYILSRMAGIAQAATAAILATLIRMY